MNIPFTYTQINLAEGRVFPSTVQPYNNQTFAYWARAYKETV